MDYGYFERRKTRKDKRMKRMYRRYKRGGMQRSVNVVLRGR